MIPNRSRTDLQLAQHLLSPLSRQSCEADGDRDEDQQVSRILHFGTSSDHGDATKTIIKPLSDVKIKLKIPTNPDRVMAAPGTFIDSGKKKTSLI